jgi:hypothetical protein
MLGSVSDYQADKWLKQLVDGPVWASLHTEDPNMSASLLTEIQGGQYQRAPVKWTQTSRLIVNYMSLAWVIPGVTTIRALGGYSEVVNGNLLFSVPLSSPVSFTQTGGVWTVAKGQLAIALDLIPGI